MQVSPELLLVLGVHQFIHTLVHDVSLGKGEFPLIIPLMLVLQFHTDLGFNYDIWCCKCRTKQNN